MESSAEESEVTSFYGYDLGERDKDMGKNDDASAIAWLPPTSREQSETPSYGGLEDVLSFDFRFGDQTQKLAPGTGGYYKAPVPIRIPRTLEPLPSKLVPLSSSDTVPPAHSFEDYRTIR
jgi:hypothetical protein